MAVKLFNYYEDSEGGLSIPIYIGENMYAGYNNTTARYIHIPKQGGRWDKPYLDQEEDSEEMWPIYEIKKFEEIKEMISATSKIIRFLFAEGI